MPDMKNTLNSEGWRTIRKRDRKSVSGLKQPSPGQSRMNAGKSQGTGVESCCRSVSKLKHSPACSPFAGLQQPWMYQM